MTNAPFLSFPTPSSTSFTSSHLIYFSVHLIFISLRFSPPSTFYHCLIFHSDRCQTWNTVSHKRHTLYLATVRLSVRSHRGREFLEFKGEWDLCVVGRSDEVNRSAETDSRQNQISVQIPACSDPSTQECLASPKCLEIVNLADFLSSLFSSLSSIISPPHTQEWEWYQYAHTHTYASH